MRNINYMSAYSLLMPKPNIWKISLLFFILVFILLASTNRQNT